MEQLIEMLKQMGFDSPHDDIHDDMYILETLYNYKTLEIKSYCNIDKLNESLEQVVIFRTLGEYLESKYKSNSLPQEVITSGADAVVEKIKEGDTEVTFKTDGTESSEQKVYTYAVALKSYGMNILNSYRCIKW